ncbi:hypothetical protein [Kitasatospora sp. CB02891]|uniref:hypothetical protein n=1 Tax=Kitasatospora sp. CB02891 TaxID=2020329 RepID=UPI000C27476A|nr:hypothetical protein [Kitasatospora sp. CB02891]PJN27780.1 hypothetical protein CG736_06090 [Kitasatospora sp. CB02891]
MVLSVAELRAKFGKTFELDPGTTGIEGLANECTQYLKQGKLALTDAQPNADELWIVGDLDWKTYGTVRSRVTFLPDLLRENVAGVRVEARLPPGAELPDSLRSARKAVDGLGVSETWFVFGVEAGRDDRVRAGTGFGVALAFPDSGQGNRPYLWGYQPAAHDAWRLDGRFAPVTLGSKPDSLKALEKLTGRPDGSGYVLPNEITSAVEDVRVSALAVVFDPGTNAGAARLFTLQAEVELGPEWRIFDGKLVVRRPCVLVNVIGPRGAKPRLSLIFAGEVAVDDEISVVLQVEYPSWRISGRTKRPVGLKKLLATYAPELPAMPDTVISRLDVWGVLVGEGAGYGFDIAFDDLWSITDEIALSGLQLSMGKQGTSLSASLDAEWDLGAAVLDVHADWTKDQGWQLAANASHLQLADAFGLFGVSAPALLKDVSIDLLSVTYGSRTGLGFAVVAGFPLGSIDAGFEMRIGLAKKSSGSGYTPTVEAALYLELPSGDPANPRLLEFRIANTQTSDFTATCTDTAGVSLADLAKLLGVADESVTELLGKLGKADRITIGYSAARKAVVFAVHEKETGGAMVFISVKP